MSGYAVVAKAEAEIVDPTPPDWPPDWDWPGPPWPPGWQSSAFTNVYPADGARGVSTTPTLSWSFTYALNGETYYADSYSLYVDDVHIADVTPSSYSGSFPGGTEPYEWKIIAHLGGSHFVSREYEFETRLRISGSSSWTVSSTSSGRCEDWTIFTSGAASQTITSSATASILSIDPPAAPSNVSVSWTDCWVSWYAIYSNATVSWSENATDDTAIMLSYAYGLTEAEALSNRSTPYFETPLAAHTASIYMSGMWVGNSDSNGFRPFYTNFGVRARKSVSFSGGAIDLYSAKVWSPVYPPKDEWYT